MLAYLVQHNITPGNSVQRLFSARNNNNEWNGLLKSANLFEAYCAAQKAQKKRLLEGNNNNHEGNAGTGENAGEYRLCLLVCAEIEERLRWAAKQRGGGGERLLWQEAVISGKGNKIMEWKWNAAASRDRKVLMDWFHAGMHAGTSTFKLGGGRGGM